MESSLFWIPESTKLESGIQYSESGNPQDGIQNPRLSLFRVCITWYQQELGEFSTVMQTLDFVSGLHNCLEFSQPLWCLYQAMQKRKTFSIA